MTLIDFSEYALSVFVSLVNLGISAAMKGVWNTVSFRGTDILVSDASASFAWKTRASFWNIVGRTARSSDVLMKRVAELEANCEWLRLSGASLMVQNRRLELERDLRLENPYHDEPHRAEWDRLRDALKNELEQTSSYPQPILKVVGIGGAPDVLGFNFGRPHYNAFEGGWDDPIPRYQVPASADSPWARVMASMRTDFDRFSTKERRFLEIWGYERAREIWGFRSTAGPPGWQPDTIGEPPTNAQLTELQNSSHRKLRLIAPRDPVGIALCLTWCLLLLLVGVFGWHMALRVVFGAIEWIRLLSRGLRALI